MNKRINEAFGKLKSAGPKCRVKFWEGHRGEMEEVQRAEQGLEKKQQPLCPSRSEASALPGIPSRSILKPALQPRSPRAQSLPWAPGAFDSQRLLPQAREKAFVLCHFLPRNGCKQPNGYHYFSGNSLHHYFVRDRGWDRRRGGRRSEENHLG